MPEFTHTICETVPHDMRLDRYIAETLGLLSRSQIKARELNAAVNGKTVVVSGSGNVAIYAIEMVQKLGGKVVALSDSDGFVYDADGVDIDLVKEIKEVKRGRIAEYVAHRKKAVYTGGRGIWKLKCDIAIPCATQNELNADDAKEKAITAVNTNLPPSTSILLISCR